MIIFLYGEDTYRSRQKLNEIIEHYKKIHKSGLNLKYFDFKKDSFEDFRDSFRSFTMFDEKKLMVLKNVFLNSKIEDDFLNFLENLSDSKDLVLFYEEKIDEKRPLFKLFKKYGKSQNFELLKGKALKNWVKREFKKCSTPHQGRSGLGRAKITPDALELFISYVGNDLWQMANEIKKLVNYKNKKKIEIKDISALVKPKIETDIFKTIDAIASKNKKEALLLVKKHLEKGDSPSYILAMINFQFRNLLVIKDLIEKGKSLNAIFKEVDLHPFVIKKSYALSKKFKFDELKKIYQKIFQADLDIKTGKIDSKAALETLLIKI
ncbi:DNA polymerase III subunit delta [Patescibacteria group bacterium]|nr:DNA polymerase III subunit delta [Patescibacteria group bacterium]